MTSVAYCMPATILNDIILPHPVDPTRTISVPSSTVRSSESTATVPSSNTFVTFSNTTSVTSHLTLSSDVVEVPERTVAAATGSSGGRQRTADALPVRATDPGANGIRD